MSYKYLGRRVKDTRKKGLDSIREYKDLAEAILRDYRYGRISKKTAQGRLLLLYRLVYNNSKLRVSKESKDRLAEWIKKKMREL